MQCSVLTLWLAFIPGLIFLFAGKMTAGLLDLVICAAGICRSVCEHLALVYEEPKGASHALLLAPPLGAAGQMRGSARATKCSGKAWLLSCF